jgi:hypothetical protein
VAASLREAAAAVDESLWAQRMYAVGVGETMYRR